MRRVNHWKRLGYALLTLCVILAVGTFGYLLLGFGFLDAVYQTVTTVTTVGFEEVIPFDDRTKWFTIVLIMAGVGTALYTLGVLLETLVEGQLGNLVERKRMQRDIAAMKDHTIVCGWGRVGRTIARYTAGLGHEVVVIDIDSERLEDCPYPFIAGDATDDDILSDASLSSARALVAAVDNDAANLFIVVSARALRDDLFIVARARSEANEPKLTRAGADRVVNPQQIGGARMAAFVDQPNVAEFLDVVMHDGSLEFRLAEIAVGEDSVLRDRSIRESHLRDQTGALVLAIRSPSGVFRTNPDPETVLGVGDVLIAVGTVDQLDQLRKVVV